MKYEIERTEAMEEQEIQQNLEMNPPKLEKVEASEQGTQNMENPPKLDRETKLGGTVMEMKLEMDKLKLEQLQEQVFGEGGKLGESRDVFNARKKFEASTNSIEAKNRAEDLKEAIEEDARKKAEYREKLYGDKA